MKYDNYEVGDFIKDEYFLLWVLNPDTMTNSFWENWLAAHPDKREVVEKSKRLVLLMHVEEDQLSDQDFDAMWRNIIEKRGGIGPVVKVNGRERQQWFIRVAAVFLGLILTCVGLYSVGAFQPTASGSLPDASQITLQLEDGTVTVLDGISSKVIVNGAGKTVVKQEENRLHYENGDPLVETIQYNQLSVPYGKKFELLLSDGSQVVLNSGSILRYPVHFLKNASREVYLDGEAYFSIQKDETRSFTVMTDRMNTRVHGTQFNVSSYKDDKNASTVLVEGSVDVYKVNTGQPAEYVVVQPGQRALFKENAIAVEEVDVRKYISWKEDRLLFVDDSFELIIKQLQRHFDVAIENRFTALNDKKFTGTFEKETLAEILRVCQEHTPFDYSVDGDQVIITERK